MIVLSILSVITLLFIMTYAALSELGVESSRRKILYTILGGYFVLKSNLDVSSNYKKFNATFKKRKRGLNLVTKSVLYTILLPLDFKRAIETITVVSVVMEKTYISDFKSANSFISQKKEMQQIKGFLKHFSNHYH